MAATGSAVGKASACACTCSGCSVPKVTARFVPLAWFISMMVVGAFAFELTAKGQVPFLRLLGPGTKPGAQEGHGR